MTYTQKERGEPWDEEENEIRLVTSWDTTEEDVRNFVEDVKRVSLGR